LEGKRKRRKEMLTVLAKEKEGGEEWGPDLLSTGAWDQTWVPERCGSWADGRKKS